MFLLFSLLLLLLTLIIAIWWVKLRFNEFAFGIGFGFGTGLGSLHENNLQSVFVIIAECVCLLCDLCYFAAFRFLHIFVSFFFLAKHVFFQSLHNPQVRDTVSAAKVIIVLSSLKNTSVNWDVNVSLLRKRVFFLLLKCMGRIDWSWETLRVIGNILKISNNYSVCRCRQFFLEICIFMLGIS